jgi:type II secretory pathway predicted ATPase ExeA
MINKLARLLQKKGSAQLSEIYSVVELDEPFLDRNKSRKSGTKSEDVIAGAKRAVNSRLGKIGLGGKRNTPIFDGADTELGGPVSEDDALSRDIGLGESEAKSAESSDIGDGSDRASDDRGDPSKVRALTTVLSNRAMVLAADDDTGKRRSSGFKTYANARLWRRDNKNLSYLNEVTKLYRDVYTPTRPKQRYDEFAGRKNVIDTIVQAIEEERAHVVVYGGRKMGKTSLANVVTELAKEAGYLIARITVTTDMKFKGFVQAVLEQLSSNIGQAPAGDVLQKSMGTEDLSAYIDEEELTVPDTLKLFEMLSGVQALVVIDDYDRIRDDGLRIKIAELMEAMSDSDSSISFLLFGRAESVTDLFPNDLAYPPTAANVALNPMDEDETVDTLTNGARRLGIGFSDDVIRAISHLSQGMPGAIQWLSLLSIREAVQRYSTEAEMEDLTAVLDYAATKIDPELSRLYDDLCGARRTAWAKDLMFLAAQSPQIGHGFFSTTDMSRLSPQVLGRTQSELSLHSGLARLSAGGAIPMVEKWAKVEGSIYRFINPVMRTIILLKNAHRMDEIKAHLIEGPEVVSYLPSPHAS